jgi:branched-chain amino acid transport system ATP-binding protein
MLRVIDLCVYYGEILVLNNLSFSIEEKKIFSLIGANGAGKSTLINTISGLIRPTAGHIYLNELELTNCAAHEIVRKGIVQIPEGRKLFPQMTVYENLMVGGSGDAQIRGKRQRKLAEIYANFPLLRERASQLAGTLSGGEQQMVAIARGLMSQPKFLMLDEPSLGLAPIIVRDIFRIIKSLNRQGITIFLVEQNIKQSLTLCDFAYVMQNGHIVIQGPGNELLINEVTKKAYLGM